MFVHYVVLITEPNTDCVQCYCRSLSYRIKRLEASVVVICFYKIKLIELDLLLKLHVLLL